MNIQDEHTFLGPLKIWILHPDRPEGPQWRRCLLELQRDPIGTLNFCVRVRNKSDGASGHDLFTSYGFIGCLDRVLEDILRSTFQEKIAQKFHELPGDRRNWIIHHSNRGFGSTEGKSPRMHFSLPYEVKELLENASGHEKIALQQGAAKIIARQEDLKSRFGPIK